MLFIPNELWYHAPETLRRRHGSYLTEPATVVNNRRCGLIAPVGDRMVNLPKRNIGELLPDENSTSTRRPWRLGLPDRLADFAQRGFRVDRPVERAALEFHARNFLAGFNAAAACWPSVHDSLKSIPAPERGFAYEGAGMYASLRDLAGISRGRGLSTLSAGPGDHYVHLTHVGAGWISGSLRLPLPVPVRLPATPLLRWLAVDGAGFAEAYFGGERALRRRVGRTRDRLWAARVAGCGRALWFLQCADAAGVTGTIASVRRSARPHLWNGIGLAIAYAGCVDSESVAVLAGASGEFWSYLAQGAVFAANARVRAGVVPAHTEMVCRTLFTADVDETARWADLAAMGLEDSRDLAAYYEWKSRIRRSVNRCH
jgi:hypothetical protein